MRFIKTNSCPKLPSQINPKTTRKPCRHLSDDEIDQALEFMIDHGAQHMALPATQYGRRVAVEAHIAYERVRQRGIRE